MADEPKLQELDKLIAMGKQKGFLTYDEVNDALPQDIVSLDQLDDIMMMFGAMDIEVVDTAAKGAGRLPSEIETQAEADDDEPGDAPIDLTPGPVGRTEDPVRLYLREMGRVSLLTREGEITLAKRIEEGKDEVTRAILATNLALEKIQHLRDELKKDVDLRKTVIRELGNTDRMLRERDKLMEAAKKLRARAVGKKRPKGEPPWKKFEQQALAKQARVLGTLRSPTLQP